MIPLVDLKAQYSEISDEIKSSLDSVFENSEFILGSQVKDFEKRFQAYCGAELPALGVNSGTSALHLALLAAGIGTGDEVITVAMTFVATAAAIRYVGATPVFVDIFDDIWTMNHELVEAQISPRTKAIIPVHLHGRVCDMDAINDIAKRHDLIVIEDAAQAHGAHYRGQPAGSLADFSCFSFYAGKNLGAAGEGGAVFARATEARKKMSLLRDWGSNTKYVHDILGYNYRMEGIQGAVLNVKLNHIEEWTLKRGRHAQSYLEKLAGKRIVLPALPNAKDRHSWHVFSVKVADRDKVMEQMKKSGIGVGMHYPVPLHLQPCMADLNYRVGDLPNTEAFANQCLSLPMYPELTENQIDEVCKQLLIAI